MTKLGFPEIADGALQIMAESASRPICLRYQIVRRGELGEEALGKFFRLAAVSKFRTGR
jgi:hypothetical protein